MFFYMHVMFHIKGQLPKEWDEKDKNVVLYLSPTRHIFAMAPGAAECICDPRNPYYDKQKASERALLLVVQNDVPGEMLHYLIANNMLPDACMKSTISAEHGRQLMQQNIDFFARTLRRLAQKGRDNTRILSHCCVKIQFISQKNLNIADCLLRYNESLQYFIYLCSQNLANQIEDYV